MLFVNFNSNLKCKRLLYQKLHCLSYSNTDLLQNLNNDPKKLKATEFKNKHQLVLQNIITTSRPEKCCHAF